MPRVGVPNNPSGANNWQGMGDEEPYGQKTKDATLARGAPLAGARIAAGPIAAPKRSGRAAQRGTPVRPPETASGPPVAPEAPLQMSPEAQLAQRWQAIAAIPGASPLVQEYAALATRRLAGG